MVSRCCISLFQLFCLKTISLIIKNSLGYCVFGLKNKARDLASVLMRHWHMGRGATGL